MCFFIYRKPHAIVWSKPYCSSETLVIFAKQLSTGLGWGRYLIRLLGVVLVSLCARKEKKWHRQLRLTFGYNFHSNKLTMISWPCIRLDAKQAWEITTIGFCLESRQRTCNQEGNGGGRWRSPASQDHFQGTVWFQVQREETCQISASYPKNSSIKASSSGSLLSITNKFSIAVWCF